MISKTPWVERKFNFDFPVTNFPIIVERLRGTVLRVEDMVKEIPEPRLINKPDGKWSLKEHIGHLIELEQLHDYRIDQFLNNEEVLKAADMSNRTTDDGKYNQKAIAFLLVKLKKVRSVFIAKIQDLTAEQLNRKALHPRLQQEVRLVDMAFFVSEHDDHHLATMRELLSE